MDAVTAGQCDNPNGITVCDVIEVGNVQVAVPVNAAVAVGLLGIGVAGAAQPAASVSAIKRAMLMVPSVASYYWLLRLAPPFSSHEDAWITREPHSQ
jgi:hypothetical protein